MIARAHEHHAEPGLGRVPHQVTSALLAGNDAVGDSLTEIELDQFAAWATLHRVAPMFFHISRGRLRSRLRDAHTMAVADELERSSWIPAFLDAANARQAGIVAFKGLGVAHDERIYPAPSLRPLGDLDVLVGRDNLDLAIQAARDVGFELEHDDPAVQEYLCNHNSQVPVYHPSHGLLEIHYGFWGDLPVDVAPTMLERAYSSSVYGRETRRLEDADLFLLLAVHLARSGRAFVWSWLLDLAYLGDALSARDWETLCERTVAWGCPLYVLACVQMLADLWKWKPGGLTPRLHALLSDSLRWPERIALDRLRTRLPRGPLGGDAFRVARYLSGRQTNLRRPWRKLVPHPGIVCLDLGVRSDDPAFIRHRLRHAFVRAQRLLTSGDGS